MADLNVICWLWGSKYRDIDVIRLRNGVRKYLHESHRFLLFTDQVLYFSDLSIDVRPLQDRHLTTRSCFCRLRMFDPHWQKLNGLEGRILSLDLDLVLVSRIDALLQTASTFKILQGANATNPNPFNASIMLLRCGHHAEVWNDFSPGLAQVMPFHEFPDDQGWIWHKLPKADGWKVGKDSGIYAFQKPGWRTGSIDLPSDAKIVAFIGKRKPRMYEFVPWVRQYWTHA